MLHLTEVQAAGVNGRNDLDVELTALQGWSSRTRRHLCRRSHASTIHRDLGPDAPAWSLKVELIRITIAARQYVLWARAIEALQLCMAQVPALGLIGRLVS